MKRKSYASDAHKGSVLKKTVLKKEPQLVVNVRAAKDQLSSLLEAAARGDEVVITSDGRPKAKLVAVQPRRRPFRMHWSWLRAQTMSPAIFKRANHLLERCHPRVHLLSLDALHLACADQAQDWPLATHEQGMREAADLLGYPLTPLP